MSKNISGAVREVIARKPYVLDYLGAGILNTRALARSISREVAREAGRPAKLQSIVTALRRLPRKKSKKRDEALEILSRSRVNLKYDIGLITFTLSRENLRKLEEIKSAKKRNLIIVQGIETITLLGEEKHIRELGKIFPAAEEKKDLAFVVVESPKEIAATPGVIARIAGILAAEKINIQELLSSYTETCLVLKEEDALKAVEVIRREVRQARA